jgi:hypothetical protein
MSHLIHTYTHASPALRDLFGAALMASPFVGYVLFAVLKSIL